MKKRITSILLVMFIMAGTVFFGGCRQNGSKESNEYKKGTLTETGFESDYLKLKFTAPEDYVMSTDDELLELADFGMEIAYSDADKKSVDYAKANTVYEMMATAPAGIPNVIVMVEKPHTSLNTIDKYTDKLLDDLTGVDGMEYVFDGKTADVDFAGQTYTKLSLTLNGIIKQDYFVRKEGGRIIAVVTTYTEESMAEMESLLERFEKK